MFTPAVPASSRVESLSVTPRCNVVYIFAVFAPAAAAAHTVRIVVGALEYDRVVFQRSKVDVAIADNGDRPRAIERHLLAPCWPRAHAM